MATKKKKVVNKLCAECGKEFTPSRPNVCYCTEQCKQRHKYYVAKSKNHATLGSTSPTAVPCLQCGKKFEYSPSTPGRKFCCVECRVRYNANILLKRNEEIRKAKEAEMKRQQEELQAAITKRNTEKGNAQNSGRKVGCIPGHGFKEGSAYHASKMASWHFSRRTAYQTIGGEYENTQREI